MENATFSSAKISVWWDIENCQVPRNFNPNSIAQNITSSLFNLNFHGPLSISAYGDTNRIPFHVQHALSSTGISLHHVPAGAKDASDKMILVDMLLWAIDNPAPANYLLISGDRDFSNALHQLRMRRYNILLAQPFCASATLAAAATIVWSWPTLIAGGPPYNNVPNQNPNFTKKLEFRLKSAIENVEIQIPESNNDNNNSKDCSFTNTEQSKTSKLFRLAPHEFFSSSSNDPTLIPTISTNHQSHHHDSTKSINDDNRKLMLQISSGYGDAPILSTSAPIVVRETREDFKPTSTLTASLKVHNNNPNCDGSGQEFCNGNLKQRNLSFGGGSDSQQLLFSNVRRVKSLPLVSAYENLQGLVAVILATLNTLKDEMIFPTERNIVDCIRYGDPKYKTIDVRKALDCAVEQKRVVKRCFGALHLYVIANESLWKCVNPLGECPSQYPEAIWVRIKQFLASSTGRSSILASHCRYEASLILKRFCLKELVLGDILKILEILINVKKWIIPYHSGWQPITISLAETKDDN